MITNLGSGASELASIVAAWRLAPDPWPLAPAASEAGVAAAERALGRPLPHELRALYALCNGPNPLGGNLAVHPLPGLDRDQIALSIEL